jgi:arylsulfatase A
VHHDLFAYALQGYGEVGAMPGKNNSLITPNIDRLFASGITFTSAYAGQAVCAPSRGSLMTSYHMGHAYIRGNHDVDGHDLPLRPQDFTLAMLLQQTGYTTQAVGAFLSHVLWCCDFHSVNHIDAAGKWGLGWINSTGSPLAKGFDTYFGMPDQNDCHNMYECTRGGTCAKRRDICRLVSCLIPWLLQVSECASAINVLEQHGAGVFPREC